MLPSATEILFALGAGDDVVGVTFECDYPAQARSCRIVSTTTLSAGLTPREIDAEVRSRLAAGEDLYRLDKNALREVDPDLVLTQDLCAVCAVDVSDVGAALSHLGCSAAVLTLDPSTLSDVLESIVTIGTVTGHVPEALELVDSLRDRLDRLVAAVAGQPRPRVAVIEWADPPFSTGHWVPDMVAAAGAVSVLGRSGQRSVETRWQAIADTKPDLIVVAPCGFRLPQATAMASDLVAARRLPEGVPVWAVDADAAFVRPGPRLIDGVEALAAICHPGCTPTRADIACEVRSAEPLTV